MQAMRDMQEMLRLHADKTSNNSSRERAQVVGAAVVSEREQMLVAAMSGQPASGVGLEIQMKRDRLK